MFNIAVESPHFMGKTLVEQHRMVVECLQDDIKSIHSYNLKTKAPHSNGQQNGQEWSKRVL
jgi:stress-induced morphogen